MLGEARSVTNGVNRLRAKAQRLLEGLEASITIVLDAMLPDTRVLDALRGFRAAFPTVALNVRSEGLGAVTQIVLDGIANIGVRGPPDVEVAGLGRIGIGSVQLVLPGDLGLVVQDGRERDGAIVWRRAHRIGLAFGPRDDLSRVMDPQVRILQDLWKEMQLRQRLQRSGSGIRGPRRTVMDV